VKEKIFWVGMGSKQGPNTGTSAYCSLQRNFSCAIIPAVVVNPRVQNLPTDWAFDDVSLLLSQLPAERSHSLAFTYCEYYIRYTVNVVCCFFAVKKCLKNQGVSICVKEGSV
jgi:hypothetical protein